MLSNATCFALGSCSCRQSLKEVLTAQVPIKQEEMKQLKAEFGHKSLGEVTVDQVGAHNNPICGRPDFASNPILTRMPYFFSPQCIGGGRGIKSMLYETSLLDADEVRSYASTLPAIPLLL